MSSLLRILSLGTLSLELADVPAYAMVGAASVLAALFRAPLTASLLLFELTRDYDVILPLMVSAGVGSVICDILDARWKQVETRRQARRGASGRRIRGTAGGRRGGGERDGSVSWGDLGDRFAPDDTTATTATRTSVLNR